MEAYTYTDLVPNATLGHYTLVEHVADGGMGHVFRAFEPSLQRDVAIKVLKNEFAEDEEVLRQFEQEAQNIAALRHPNIVPIYYVGQQGKLYFFVMPFISGQTLDAWVDSGTRLNLEEARWVLYQAIDALDRALAQNIIHMDIKPSNFLVDDNGTILLTDFGLAKVLGSNSDVESEDCFGTPAYMCPEQIMRKDVDQRSDIYSLGATLFHLITAEFLFESESIAALVKAHLQSPFPIERAEACGLPPGWIHLLEKMTRKKPSERYQDYTELREALNHVDRLSPVRVAAGAVLDEPEQVRLAVIPVQDPDPQSAHHLLGERFAAWGSGAVETGIQKSKEEIFERITKSSGLHVDELIHPLRELCEPVDLEMGDLSDAVAMVPEVDDFINALARCDLLCGNGKIETRRQAIRRVGMGLSGRLLLSAVMIQNFKKGESEFAWSPYWKQAVATGVVAHYLRLLLMGEFIPGRGPVEVVKKVTITTAFSRHALGKSEHLLFPAALAHGIGKIILGETAAFPYYTTLQNALTRSSPLSVEEQLVFQTDHHEVADKWFSLHRFDPALRQTANSYNNLHIYDGIIPALVGIASHIVRMYGIGYGGDPVLQTRDVWHSEAWKHLAEQCKSMPLTADYMDQEFVPLVASLPIFEVSSPVLG